MVASRARISIHTPREGGDLQSVEAKVTGDFISIHTPREGGDHGRHERPIVRAISIHTPREGGDSKNNRKNSGNFCDVYNTISFLHKSA